MSLLSTRPRLRRRLLVLGAAALLLAAAGVAAILLYGPGPVLHGDAAGADAGDATLVALGAGVYAAECAGRHGAQLEGQPNWRERLPNRKLPAPPHDASGHTWHHPDQILFEITKEAPAALVPGYKTDMPAYKGRLCDREIRAVLAYIKSTWPEAIRARQERLPAPRRGG